MGNNISVSLITASFNSAKTIEDTIKSVLAQDYGNIEYLIIDGASKDNTVAIAESYSDQFERRGFVYKVVSEPDKGIYDAMDKGISLATGDIIGIVNSDDWLESGSVSKVVERFVQTDCDAVFGDINVIRNGSSAFVKHAKIRNYKTSRDLCHPGMFVARLAYEKYGVYDTSYRLYADLDFWLRLFRNKARLEILGTVVSNYRIGGASSKKTFKQTMASTREKYRAYRSNGYSRFYFIECVGMEFGKYLYMKLFG